MHLAKAQSREPFGIYFSPSQSIAVYDGHEVYTLAFDSPEEYALYMEYVAFYSKVLKMLEEFFSQNPSL
jgi:hypothetical protein